MAFTTYEFYTTSYHGDTVDESSFPKWESKAEDKLRYYCGDNLTEWAELEFATKISKATCALIDLIYQIDYATKNANNANGGNVKSMSSGGQSISFGSNETVISKVLADRKAQDKLYTDTLIEYLWDTGLLYMGV